MNSASPFALDGRVALVTGSSRGLGRQIALDLARAGAAVAMNYANDRPTAEAAFAQLQTLSARSCLVGGDVTDAAAVDAICSIVNEELGPIDVLVVNATCPQPQLPFDEYDWAFFERMHDFFVKSPVLLMRACLPHMKRQRWGRIIHITSEVFALGVPQFSAYVAAKGGQTGLARSTARELAPHGVTVNMVAPGWIPVQRHADEPQESLDAYLAEVPAARWGTPADVAAACVYLASDAAAFVTGQTIAVNGGHTVY
ncbi:MAG: SDR family oxidoreductase [Pirellulales bacterium]|nr:SDR family oxidoreductase [Pirellulales bacterium]